MAKPLPFIFADEDPARFREGIGVESGVNTFGSFSFSGKSFNA
nr:hypothetical protein [uncultured Dyadobacter sp.]